MFECLYEFPTIHGHCYMNVCMLYWNFIYWWWWWCKQFLSKFSWFFLHFEMLWGKCCLLNFATKNTNMWNDAATESLTLLENPYKRLHWWGVKRKLHELRNCGKNILNRIYIVLIYSISLYGSVWYVAQGIYLLLNMATWCKMWIDVSGTHVQRLGRQLSPPVPSAKEWEWK